MAGDTGLGPWTGTETLQDDVSHILEDSLLEISPETTKGQQLGSEDEVTGETNYSVKSVAVGNNAIVNVVDGLAFGDGAFCGKTTPDKVAVGQTLMGYEIPLSLKHLCYSDPEAIKWFVRLLASAVSYDGNVDGLDEIYGYKRVKLNPPTETIVEEVYEDPDTFIDTRATE